MKRTKAPEVLVEAAQQWPAAGAEDVIVRLDRRRVHFHQRSVDGAFHDIGATLRAVGRPSSLDLAEAEQVAVDDLYWRDHKRRRAEDSQWSPVLNAHFGDVSALTAMRRS
jgi:hypothetical protein